MCQLAGAAHGSKTLAHDYLSVSPLSHKIVEHKPNIILVITKSQFVVYNRLAKFAEGSVIGKLATNSSTFVGLVQSNYEKISSMVKLNTEGADGIKLSVKSKCSGQSFSKGAKC